MGKLASILIPVTSEPSRESVKHTLCLSHLHKKQNISVLHLNNFIVTGAGDLPKSEWLRQNYVPKAQEEYEAKVKEAVKNENLVIHCDETTDRKGQAVFVMILKTLPKDSSCPRLFVVGCKVLQNANSQECSQALVKMLTKFDINYSNVIGIATDSARYMGVCIKTMQGLVSESLLHIQCWAHKLDNIAKLFPKYLNKLNYCISNTKKAFRNTRKRKHKYLSYLQSKYDGSEKQTKLFPAPVLTRWKTWVESALYIEEYLCDLVDYFKSVDGDAEGVKYFRKLSSNEIRAIHCEASFVKYHLVSTTILLTEFEGNKYPLAHKLVPKLVELQNQYSLIERLLLHEETQSELTKLSSERQEREQEKYQALGKDCKSKLSSMLTSDPAASFFQACSKLFHLPNVHAADVSAEQNLLKMNIPLLKSIGSTEFLKFYLKFQSLVKLCGSANSEKDKVYEILKGMLEDDAEIASRCIQSIFIPVNNVDAERAFSGYSDILTDKRTRLLPQNVETALNLYFGDGCDLE